MEGCCSALVVVEVVTTGSGGGGGGGVVGDETGSSSGGGGGLGGGDAVEVLPTLRLPGGSGLAFLSSTVVLAISFLLVVTGGHFAMARLLVALLTLAGLLEKGL